MPPGKSPDPTYAQALRAAMERGGARPTTIRQLAEESGWSYEHIRKILKGEPIVTDRLNRDLGAALKLSEAAQERMWSLAQKERVLAKYGEAIASSAVGHIQADALLHVIAGITGGSRERLRILAESWPNLTASDQQRLLDMAAVWGRQEKR